MSKKMCRLLIFIGLLALPGTALAKYTITPTKLFINPNEKVTSMTIENDDSKEARFELDIYRWEQKGGKDVLTPENEVIVTPEEIRIPPYQTQLVQVGIKNLEKRDVEIAYRLFVRELPPTFKTREAGNITAQVNIVTSSSVPVFVEPIRSAENLINCDILGNAAQPKLFCKNYLNHHIYIAEMEIFNTEKSIKVALNKYLFPNKTFEVALNKQTDISKLKINLTTHYSKEKIELSLGYSPNSNKADRDLPSIETEAFD